MKEAIANAGVFNLVAIFVAILIAFFIGSLGYSKAFKVKNYIVNEIEKSGYESKDRANINKSIDSWLKEIGYRVNSGYNKINCPVINDSRVSNGGSALNNESKYQYCIYEFVTKNGLKESKYYRVVAYMYFDVPIVEDIIRVPVVGETASFTDIKS